MSHTFISYSHEDDHFAGRLARDLQDAGLNIWIDTKIIPATEWIEAIMDALRDCDFLIVCLTPNAVRSEWVRREVFTARAHHKRVLPLLVKKQEMTPDGGIVQTLELLRKYDELDTVRHIQMIDFEKVGYAAAFKTLLDILPNLTKQPLVPPSPSISDGTTAIDPATIANPFKGLESFQQTDAHLFFGREELTAQLIRRLDEQGGDRFVAVVGASGIGKSSLVRAGVIPKLREGALPGSAEWLVAIFTPGESPTQSLALRLLPILKNQLLPNVLAALNQGSEALDQLAEGVLADADPTARLLLVVDQFEEVFTRASAGEAQKFLDLLVTAVTIRRGRVFAVLTMRADFFDRLSGYPALARLFEDENLLIATEMTPDALRRSIELPAAAVGLVYDHGLVDMILEDVRQQPGSLPLMEYALKRLYEERDGRRLTKNAYSTMGGVQGALAAHAEALYTAMDVDTQAAVRRILLGLVEVSATGEATRRRVNRSALNFKDIPAETVDSVIATLSNAGNRLLIVNREVMAEGTAAQVQAVEVQIEVAHEALLREWRRLAGWITADKADLYYGGELLKDAQEWMRAAPERKAEYALIGMRLREAQSWLTRADANDDQRQFIAASADEEARQLAAEQTRREELRLASEQAERQRRRARSAIVVAVLLIVVAAGVGVFAGVQTNIANIRISELNDIAPGATLAVQIAPDATRSARWYIWGETQSLATRLQLAEDGVPIGYISNAEWTPIIQEFDGVMMVQVPPGCFMMGSEDGDADERPIHQQCFDVPFWIDQTEVTQADFERLGGVKISPNSFDGDQRPVEFITWFEAREFCILRGARLPTEAEWEYAARGPDALAYPWGNHWDSDNAVWFGNSSNQTANVGSRPAGMSWVGAQDMSGNVWEWVSTIYKGYAYPYDATDGRENIRETDGHVLRGGSWYNSNTTNLRTTYRALDSSSSNYNRIGLRCALS